MSLNIKSLLILKISADIIKFLHSLIISALCRNISGTGLMHKRKGHLQIELFQCDEIIYVPKITDDRKTESAELKSKSATYKPMGSRITTDNCYA